MGDDAIGAILVDRIRDNPFLRELPFFPDIQFVNLGSGGMKILHNLASMERAIIIDAGDFGGDPGDHRLIVPEEVKSVKFLPQQSVHEFDLLRAIELSVALKECPSPLMIMCIQPERIEWGEELSETLHNRLTEYENVLMDAVKELAR